MMKQLRVNFNNILFDLSSTITNVPIYVRTYLCMFVSVRFHFPPLCLKFGWLPNMRHYGTIFVNSSIRTYDIERRIRLYVSCDIITIVRTVIHILHKWIHTYVRTYTYFPISLGETVTAYVRSYGNIIGAVLELIF